MKHKTEPAAEVIQADLNLEAWFLRRMVDGIAWKGTVADLLARHRTSPDSQNHSDDGVDNDAASLRAETNGGEIMPLPPKQTFETDLEYNARCVKAGYPDRSEEIRRDAGFPILTGRQRHRRNWRGKLILQVEERVLNLDQLFPIQDRSTSTRWRDAKLTDFYAKGLIVTVPIGGDA